MNNLILFSCFLCVLMFALLILSAALCLWSKTDRLCRGSDQREIDLDLIERLNDHLRLLNGVTADQSEVLFNMIERTHTLIMIKAGHVLAGTLQGPEGEK